MPLYDFKCEECDHVEEVLLRNVDAKDEYPKECPKCGEKECMKRQIGTSAFSLLGSGWYRDGYS